MTAVLAGISLAAAGGFRLAPWKDDLFKYPSILSTAYGGDYVKFGYVEQRDLYQRDVVPEKKTKPEYVDLGVKSVERDMVAREGRISVQYIATGKYEGGASIVVMYVHGRGGNRGQGANDWMFGGNFNRIKNLMVRNGGVYLSPGFPSLNSRGVAQAKMLLLEYAKNSPGAPVFVACGSLGGRILLGAGRGRRGGVPHKRALASRLDQRRRLLQDRRLQAADAASTWATAPTTSSSAGSRPRPSSRSSSSLTRTTLSSWPCSTPARTARRSA